MKDSHQDIRVHTHNDTNASYVERRDTRQSAARPGSRQSAVRPALRTDHDENGNDVTTEKKTEWLN